MLTVTRVATSADPCPMTSSMQARTSGRARYSAISRRHVDRHRVDRVEVDDQPGGDAVGIGAAMGAGAVRARRVDVEGQPERALLGEADRAEAARLRVQHAVAEESAALWSSR